VHEAGAPDYKGVTLKLQIDAVMNNPSSPERIKSDLHPTREIGNFSAHANRDVTGQVMRAEPDEAEWTLETLRKLLEYYYTDPAESQKRHAALEAKLAKKAEKPKRAKNAKK